MKTDNYIQNIFLIFWVIYFSITIFNTIFDFKNIKPVKWIDAENQTTVYSSRRSTIITYKYKNNQFQIYREYPGIIEGINTWLWDIDKNKKHVNISFFVKNSDFER